MEVLWWAENPGTPGRNLPTRTVVILRNSLVATNQCNSNLLCVHFFHTAVRRYNFSWQREKIGTLKKHVDAKCPEAIIRMP
jgi:hypothetical protein